MNMANAMKTVRSEEMRLKKKIEDVRSAEIDTQK